MVLYLWLKNWLESEEGQGLVEYALILVLVSIVVIIALSAIGDQVNTVFGQGKTALTKAP